MKNLLPFFIFQLFFFTLSKAQSTFNGITVRFNHCLLESEVIDSKESTFKSINEILNEKGKIIFSKSEYDIIRNLQITKIFTSLKTSDSISISRNGNKIIIPPFWATFNIQVEDVKIQQYLSKIKSLYPIIIYAHPNYYGELLDIPNDSLFSLQQSLNSTLNPNSDIEIDSAWTIETGKKYIKVGVFDSGIDTTHEDLSNAVLTGKGYFIDPYTELSSWGTDTRGIHGHGTPVAGIIGAKRNNSKGIAGIAGGNGSDTSGVSLIDFKLSPGLTSDNFARAVVDAARSVGTYHDWSSADPPVLNDEYYWSHASGYGIHIGNYSLAIKIANPNQLDTLGGKSNNDTLIEGPDEIPPTDCLLCREAFLFSLQNGVVNIVASGNGNYPLTPGINYTTDPSKIPQNYSDDWIIMAGGSGINGNWFDGFNGELSEQYWFANSNENIDVTAPATTSLVYSTASKFASDSINIYANFSGTSAAAPHVTGVAALLLSKYNQNCYSQSNLDPSDIEYILEKSADDSDSPGFDVFSGYGRVNAHKALKMIDFPEYQIVHPDNQVTQTTLVSSDTITLYLNTPLYSQATGPISSGFPLILERFYDAVKYTYELQYDISQYITSSSEIYDFWVRSSVSNGIKNFSDTINVLNQNGNYYETLSDTFEINPFGEIIQINNNLITVRGYYYHFIGLHLIQDDPSSFVSGVDYWYPININQQSPQVGISIYLRDSLAPFYQLPCDSLNLLYDSLASINDISLNPLIIYPNPGSDLLNIYNKNGITNEITIFDINGKMIKSPKISTISNQHIQLSVSNLENGTYFIVYEANGIQKTYKWIKIG